MKILIADDREENLYLLETLLKGDGYEVISAKNGVEALEKLEKEPVDMIISDILMPKMDGFRLCSKCKSDDKLKEIPFIFYTSTYRDKKAERFASSLGAQKFVVKPIEPEHLMKIIKDLFEEYKKGVTIPSKIPVEKEVVDYLKEYNEILVAKLEKKVLDLEKTTNTLKESEAELRKHREYLERELAERKRAEEQTKRLREYLQLQVNRMPIGLIVWDKEFRVRTWNPADTKIFGFTEEEAIGKHPYDLIVPKEVQPKMDDIWRRLLEGDLTTYSVNENITKDGRAIICDWANTPLKEADGTVIGVLSMVQDITERRQTEETLQESEERYRDLFENANDLIQSVNKEGKFVYVNRKWLEVLGYTKEEVKKLTMWDILRKDQIPHCMEVFKKIFSGEAVDQVETVFVSKNGEEIPVAGSADTQFKDGKFIATRGIFRDITEIKRTKEELEARVKELEEFHELTVGRELKMKQMEAEFERLRAKPGEKK